MKHLSLGYAYLNNYQMQQLSLRIACLSREDYQLLQSPAQRIGDFPMDICLILCYSTVQSGTLQ